MDGSLFVTSYTLCLSVLVFLEVVDISVSLLTSCFVSSWHYVVMAETVQQ